MKTTKANATNNFIVRFWSAEHYGEKHKNSRNMFHGSIIDTTSKETAFFNTPAKFMSLIDKMYKKAEKTKRGK